MIEKKFKITSEQGLHARPATLLVQLANEFNCKIELTLGKTTIDFKSIMGVISIGAYKGEVINIACSGDDEKEAMEKIEFQILDLKLAKEL